MLSSVLDSAGSWVASPSLSQIVNHSLLQWGVKDKKAESPVCLPGLYVLPGATHFLTPLVICRPARLKLSMGRSHHLHSLHK